MLIHPLNAPGIAIRGHTLGPRAFISTAKYGHEPVPTLQEDVLQLLGAEGKKLGFSLGEIRALFYIASMDGPQHGGLMLEFEKKRIVKWRRLVRAS